MEMRTNEDVAIGQDLTPPLPPLAAVLHDSTLSSHCSACFSPLPSHPFPPLSTLPFPPNPHHIPTLSPPLYCSLLCSSLDSPLHFSSSESHISPSPSSSDLRLALRLLQKLPQKDFFSSNPGQRLNLFGNDNDPSRDSGNGEGPDGNIEKKTTLSGQRLNREGNKENPFRDSENGEGPDGNLEKSINLWGSRDWWSHKDWFLERIGGLMTNRERLLCPFIDKRGDDGGVEDGSVLERIREGAEVMGRARRGKDLSGVVEEEGFVVEEMVLCLVMTNAVEVQDHKTGRSLGIAVYDTAFSWINHSCSPNACYWFSMGIEQGDGGQPLRICPAAMRNHGCGDGNGDHHVMKGYVGEDGYGPRVIVRSIKGAKKGEEVTIAYTDLLQPKEMRQLELRRKYRFSCVCKRCRAVPPTHVDCMLQAVCAVNPDGLEMISNTELCPDEEDVEILMERFDDFISEYLSTGNPKICCQKLEHLLTHGNANDPSESKDGKYHRKLKLHPLHHLSLNAYITLASAYRVYASDMLALNSGNYDHKLQTLDKSRTSAAYSLLLAGASHYLFMSESSILVSVATFWMNAGESLLSLAKSFLWDSQSPFPILDHKCSKCSLADVNSFDTRDPSKICWRQQIFNCIANLTSKVWSFLVSGSSYLKLIRNPIDFSWLELSPYSDSEIQFSGRKFSGAEPNEFTDEIIRVHVYILSIHCLNYGVVLSKFCCGHVSSIDIGTNDAEVPEFESGI